MDFNNLLFIWNEFKLRLYNELKLFSIYFSLFFLFYLVKKIAKSKKKMSFSWKIFTLKAHSKLDE